MSPLMVMLTGLGVIFFWIVLNISNLFRKKKHYYSFVELWEGRDSGKHPDNRPYGWVGIAILLLVGYLSSYLFLF